MGRLMAKKTVIILLKLSEEGSIIGRKKKITLRWGFREASCRYPAIFDPRTPLTPTRHDCQ